MPKTTFRRKKGRGSAVTSRVLRTTSVRYPGDSVSLSRYFTVSPSAYPTPRSVWNSGTVE
jgi:hypothetical protein